jgi:hypothetical protein
VSAARRLLAPLALVAAGALVTAAAPRPIPGSGGDDTPLTKEMEKLEQAMEVLQRSVLDAAKDSTSLEQLVVAEQACLAAKQLTPKMAPRVAEAERPKFLAGYRKRMGTMLIELVKLEQAVLDGDREQARALWKKLDAMKDDGHNEFTEGE